MGFKKGWREYRKVHGKKKGSKKKSSSKKRSYSKKKKTSKKRRYKRKNNPGRGNVKKKFTQGDMNITFAGLGAAAKRVGNFAVNQDPREFTVGLVMDYSGIDTEGNLGWQDSLSYLVRGWGGLAHEVAYRKGCQYIGSRPYPTKGSIVEHLVYYGPPAMAAYQNRDNTGEAIQAAYEKLYGVDLNYRGWDAWQPAEMLPSKAGVQIIKGIKRALRGAGVKVPSWV